MISDLVYVYRAVPLNLLNELDYIFTVAPVAALADAKPENAFVAFLHHAALAMFGDLRGACRRSNVMWPEWLGRPSSARVRKLRSPLRSTAPSGPSTLPPRSCTTSPMRRPKLPPLGAKKRASDMNAKSQSTPSCPEPAGLIQRT